MNIRKYLLCISAAVIIMSSGCMNVVVERDGEPVGGREGLVVINPAGGLLSDLTAVTEVTYEKTVNQNDSSLVTLGYGKDERDNNESTALYVLAGGRYYPMGNAPEGFFINGDIGAGYFDYKLADNADVTFLYGIGTGYKFLLGAVVFEIGAAYLKMDFKEDESEFIPVSRVQLGMTF